MYYSNVGLALTCTARCSNIWTLVCQCHSSAKFGPIIGGVIIEFLDAPSAHDSGEMALIIRSNFARRK